MEYQGMDNSSRNIAGVLLRLARIRQGKGQKEICHGLCVVSYLSKIERGKGNPDDVLLGQLFNRLGIVYETEESFLKESKEQIREYFYRNLYELKRKELFGKLKKKEERLKFSPLALDWLLIAAMEGEGGMELLESLLESMGKRQRALFYILKSCGDLDAGEKIWYCERASELVNDTFVMRHLLYAYFAAGRYNAIHYLENRFVALALEEGNTYALADYYYMNASAYACVNMEEMMAAYYRKAEHLIMNTGWQAELLPGIYYNIGAVYVELGKYELALSYLERIKQDSFLLCHKKGLAYLGLSQKEELEDFLKRMKKFLEKDENPKGQGEAERLMYEELCMRSKPGYEKNPEYLELLERLLAVLKRERPFGFLYAYRNVVRKTYAGQRKYRKALEFEREISSKALNQSI